MFAERDQRRSKSKAALPWLVWTLSSGDRREEKGREREREREGKGNMGQTNTGHKDRPTSVSTLRLQCHAHARTYKARDKQNPHTHTQYTALDISNIMILNKIIFTFSLILSVGTISGRDITAALESPHEESIPQLRGQLKSASSPELLRLLGHKTSLKEQCPGGLSIAPAKVCSNGDGNGDCPEGTECTMHDDSIYGICCHSEAPPQIKKNRCTLGTEIPDLFCGRGPGREECPSGSFCLIHPTDVFAICCDLGEMAPSTSPSVSPSALPSSLPSAAPV